MDSNEYLNLSEMETTIKIFMSEQNYPYHSLSSANDYQILYHLIKFDQSNRVSMLSYNTRYISGLYFESKGKYDEMKENYLIGIEGGCSDSMNLLGFYYYKTNDTNLMMKYYEMAINKKNIHAIFNLSKFFEKMELWDNMISTLKMAIDMGSEKAVLELGYYYQRINKLDLMIECYRTGAHKGFTSCLVKLGDYYAKQNSIDYMLKYYTVAAKSNPDAMYKLGVYFESKKMFPEMIDYYNKAIALKHTEAMIRLGDYYKKIKNSELMLYTYKLAAENNPVAMNKLGLYYQKKKLYQEMICYYTKAIQLNSVDAINNLAVYYESIGETEKMLGLLLKAISLKSSAAMYNLGLYYEKKNDYENMAKYFMMAYENGRIFNLDEVKLMKKSILKVHPQKTFDTFSKTLSEKKQKIKEFFTKDKSSPSKVSSKPKKEKSFKVSKEFSSHPSPSKPTFANQPNLIDIPNTDQSTKSLFNDVELYKIIGNINPTSSTSSSSTSNISDIFKLANNDKTNSLLDKTNPLPDNISSTEIHSSDHNSSYPSSKDMNLYKMFASLHK